MDLISTELNLRLSQWIQNRIAADHLLIASRVGFWRFTTLGLVAFGLGAAVGIGCYGYSFVTRNSGSMTTLSAELSKALAEAHLRGTAEGTVQIEPREITLASGQTVSLDRASRVQLQPGATVLAEGNIRVYTPFTASMQQPATQPSDRTPITNFTVFKAVPFDKGTVMTGWKFITSTQKSPSEEYCYYTIDAATPGVDVVLALGTNQKPEIAKTVPRTFDAMRAFEKCVWFRG